MGELSGKPDSFRKELMGKLGKNQWDKELNQIIVFKDYEFKNKKKEYCGFFRVSGVSLPEYPIRNNYDWGAAMGKRSWPQPDLAKAQDKHCIRRGSEEEPPRSKRPERKD